MKLTRWTAPLLLSSLLFAIHLFAADWPPVNADDLKLTSISEQPGAPAVILQREEIDDDMNNTHLLYERVKILTEAGREYANVEIPYSRRLFVVDGVSGRTIHPDGSVVPFEGKPFDKTVMKGPGIKVNVKSFTLPDVQVGSILDYRYNLRYDDRRLLPPTWEVQTELFQRHAYFKFIPFQNHSSMYVELAHGQTATGIAWAPFIGGHSQPQMHEAPRSLATAHQITTWVDLDMKDVPAFIEEPYMPPPSILKWRVYFYYQETLKIDDYWKDQGKFWNKDVESFVGKNRRVPEALAKTISPSDTPEQKVRKIYAFVAAMENQDYIPERTKQEEKVLELKNNNGAEDVLDHRSGTHDDLNRLFVSMVRSAGIPASLIWVPDRSEEIFIKQYLSTRQLDSEVAIVQLNGKDVFLDPGTRFCPYGLVNWRYTGVEGLRQDDKGARIDKTPWSDYRQAVTTRLATVSLDDHGIVTGTVSLMFKGSTAMDLRQLGAKTDAEGRKKMLEDDLKEILPGNSEIELNNSPDWENVETPLIAQFHVSCPFAVAAGKRWMLPQQLFQVNEKARFPSAERKSTVYFHTPWQEADEVHITIPAGMEVESLAPDDSIKLDYALYKIQHKREAPDKIFARRDFIIGQEVFVPSEYKNIKNFFDKVKADDDQPALLRLSQNVASTK